MFPGSLNSATRTPLPSVGQGRRHSLGRRLQHLSDRLQGQRSDLPPSPPGSCAPLVGRRRQFDYGSTACRRPSALGSERVAQLVPLASQTSRRLPAWTCVIHNMMRPPRARVLGRAGHPGAGGFRRRRRRQVPLCPGCDLRLVRVQLCGRRRVVHMGCSQRHGGVGHLLARRRDEDPQLQPVLTVSGAPATEATQTRAARRIT